MATTDELKQESFVEPVCADVIWCVWHIVCVCVCVHVCVCVCGNVIVVCVYVCVLMW